MAKNILAKLLCSVALVAVCVSAKAKDAYIEVVLGEHCVVLDRNCEVNDGVMTLHGVKYDHPGLGKIVKINNTSSTYWFEDLKFYHKYGKLVQVRSDDELHESDKIKFLPYIHNRTFFATWAEDRNENIEVWPKMYLTTSIEFFEPAGEDAVYKTILYEFDADSDFAVMMRDEDGFDTRVVMAEWEFDDPKQSRP